MNINRNNYEAYVIDFLEGNLSEELARGFDLFLSNHPEIYDEIANLEDAILPLDELVFDNKNLLKKDTHQELEKIDFLLAKKLEGTLSQNEEIFVEKLLLNDEETKKSWVMMQKTLLSSDASSLDLFSSLKFPDVIDYNSNDNLLIGKLEGDLNAEQQKAANKLIADGEKSFEYFRNTLVHADKNIIYPNKQALKKTAVIPLWKKLAPAIAIAAMFLLGFLFFNDTNTIEVAKTIENHNHQKVERSIKEKAVETNLADKIVAPIIDDSPRKNVKENKKSNHIDKEIEYKRVLTPELANTIAYNLVKNVDQDKTIKVQENQFVEPHQVNQPEDLADNNAAVIDNKNYKTFRDFATEKAKETLWGDEEYPEENYTAALIEKTANKVEVLDNSLPMVSKDDNGWAFRYKKFSVQRKKS